jgi:signal transduction histidine kinase
MPLDLYFTFLVGLIVLFLGIIVYLHEKKSVSNIFFSLFCLANVLFLIVNYVSIISLHQDAIFWIRFVLFTAIPQVTLFFLFVKNFPYARFRTKPATLAVVLISGISLMAAILFTPLVFSGVTARNGNLIPVPGKLIPVFGFYAVGLVIASFVLGAKRYLKSRGIKRVQWLLVGLGTALTLALVIFFNFFLTVFFHQTGFIRFTPIFLLPMIILTAYAVLRHNLLKIKVITSELATFALWVIFLTRFFLADSTREKIINGSFLIFIVFFGLILVRSVLKETKQREKLESLTDELEASNKKLLDLDKLKDEFISITSHELRTPMTSIQGYLWMLAEKGGPLNKKQKGYLQRAQKSTERMINLINDMLSISRIERGKIKFKLQEADLVAIVKNVAEGFKVRVEKKDLGLRLIFAEEKLPPIKADPDKVRQVLTNLIDNAIKYTREGEITVKTYRKGKFLHVAIKDTGKGIGKEDIPRLFKKFGRLETSFVTAAEAGGTGLGLYITKALVERMRGKISVHSELGQGSTFSFSLPIAK